MRQLNARAISVFGCLMEDPFSSVTALQIARSLGISERTVRYAISSLSDRLAQEGINLKRIPHKGFSFEPQDVARAAQFFSELTGTSAGEVPLTATQRVWAIQYALLTQTCPHSLEEIGNRLGVSRTTAVRDMKRACSWLSQKGVKASHDSEAGWVLSVDEAQRRFLMVDLLEASANLHQSQAGFSLPLKRLSMPLKTCDLEQIGCELHALLAREGLGMTDASFIGLTFYLVVTKQRVGQGQYLTAVPQDLDSNDDSCMSLALSLLKVAEIVGPDNSLDLEARMIALLLRGASQISASDLQESRAAVSERVLDTFLSQMSQQVGYDLYLDQECIQGLRAHFSALMARARLGITVKNDMLPEIQTAFPELFAQCKKTLQTLQTVYNLNTTDDEAGFLVLYLAAILEKIHTSPLNTRTIRVALVCGAGIGTVTYLSRSLAKEFPRLEICARLPAHESQNFDYQGIDLVLATVSLNASIARPVIRVTPTLTKNDVRRIESFLRLPAVHSPEQLMEDLLEIIESSCTICDRDALEQGLRNALSVDMPTPAASIPGFIRFKDLIREEHIKVHQAVSSWEEAVSLAARPLLDKGWMTLDYYHEVLDFSVEYEQFGVILAPLCAPHANADLRNHPAISVVTTQDPVTVSMGGEIVPLQVVMLLCLQSPVSLSAALDELFNIVDEEPRFIADLVDASTATQLKHVIASYCDRADDVSGALS